MNGDPFDALIGENSYNIVQKCIILVSCGICADDVLKLTLFLYPLLKSITCHVQFVSSVYTHHPQSDIDNLLQQSSTFSFVYNIINTCL